MLLRYKKIIFLLPPKTGSKSFIEMFKRVGIDFEISNKQLHPFLSEIKYNQKLNSIKDYKIYQLCRNPFYRMVSSFYFQKKIIQDKDKYKNFIDLTFDEFVYTITKNINLLPENLAEFCKKVFGDSEFYEKRLPSAYGIRFYIPQTKWVDIDVDVTYLKIEELNRDCSILKKILNTNKNLILPKINTNDKNISYKDLYSNETIELVKTAYFDDFENLNYSNTL